MIAYWIRHKSTAEIVGPKVDALIVMLGHWTDKPTKTNPGYAENMLWARELRKKFGKIIIMCQQLFRLNETRLAEAYSSVSFFQENIGPRPPENWDGMPTALDVEPYGDNISQIITRNKGRGMVLSQKLLDAIALTSKYTYVTPDRRLDWGDPQQSQGLTVNPNTPYSYKGFTSLGIFNLAQSTYSRGAVPPFIEPYDWIGLRMCYPRRNTYDYEPAEAIAAMKNIYPNRNVWIFPADDTEAQQIEAAKQLAGML